MKTLFTLLLVSIALLTGFWSAQVARRTPAEPHQGLLPAESPRELSRTAQKINPVIGDISFTEAFGHTPGQDAGEQTRIRTHLRYVEKLLRTKRDPRLSPGQLQKRERMLDLLHEYLENGQFPANEKYASQRRPCFIDRKGNICAVGYLIEQTAGRALAEKINAKHQYDYILDMHAPELLAWVETSGLSVEECAMIQPTYGGIIVQESQPEPVPTGYGIASAALGGLNLSLNALNVSQMGRSGDPASKLVPVSGIVSGTITTTMGVIGMYDVKKEPGVRSREGLSMINIGLGTATIATSIWNLATYKKRQQAEKRTFSWNLGSRTLPAGEPTLELNLVKRF